MASIWQRLSKALAVYIPLIAVLSTGGIAHASVTQTGGPKASGPEKAPVPTRQMSPHTLNSSCIQVQQNGALIAPGGSLRPGSNHRNASGVTRLEMV